MKEITIVIPAAEETKIESLKFLKREGINFIIQRGKNTSANRNKGVQRARTKFVAFINAHTLLNKNWNKEVLAFFKNHPEVDLVGGPQLNHSSENLFAKSSGYALSSIFGSAQVSTRYKQTKINLKADETLLTSANLICRREVFKSIKFDETVYPGEDPLFIREAIKNDFNVAYSPRIVVYNKRRTSIGGLFKQIFNYGKARPKIEEKSLKKKVLFFIPFFFIVYLLLLPSLLFLNKLFLIPLLAYILCDFTFSLYHSLKNRNYLSFFVLILIFPIIHLAYGSGIARGLIKK